MWLCWLTIFLNAIVRDSFPLWRRVLSYIYWKIRDDCDNSYKWMKACTFKRKTFNISFSYSPFSIKFTINALQRYNHTTKNFWNPTVEKEMPLTVPGFEPRSFDCLSTAANTELHRRPASPSLQEDLFISPNGIAFRLY